MRLFFLFGRHPSALRQGLSLAAFCFLGHFRIVVFIVFSSLYAFSCLRWSLSVRVFSMDFSPITLALPIWLLSFKLPECSKRPSALLFQVTHLLTNLLFAFGSELDCSGADPVVDF